MLHLYKTLEIKQIEPNILLVTLNRPAYCNAINSEMMQDLMHFWQTLRNDPQNFRCVILNNYYTYIIIKCSQISLLLLSDLFFPFGNNNNMV